METEPSPGSRAVAALPYLALLALAFSVFPITTDDSYITLRYAHNLISGHGAVSNPGERVEGYSSPLHMLLLAALLKLRPSLESLFMTKRVSFGFGFAGIWLTGGLG